MPWGWPPRRGCVNSLSPTTILPTTTLSSRRSRSAPAGTPSSLVTLSGSRCAYEGLELAVEPHSVRQLASTPLAPHSGRDALRGSHILVVDDDPDLRTLVNKALSQDGHIVSEASSGREALALIDAQAPDLLVLDLLMPKQGGLEVLKVLRSRPATAALPVLVLTALDDEVNTRAGFDLGATDYLAKPFSIPQLAARVRACLSRRG